MDKGYIIITGGLGGLGSAFALECARRGRVLILVDRLKGRGIYLERMQKWNFS